MFLLLVISRRCRLHLLVLPQLLFNSLQLLLIETLQLLVLGLAHLLYLLVVKFVCEFIVVSVLHLL